MPCANLATGECYPETNRKECCNVCWGYSTFQNYPSVTWVGMMLEADHDVNKCARGCIPCRQEELDTREAAAHLYGTRWMKAHEPVVDEDDNLIVPLRANRQANGMIGDLRSMNPTRFAGRVLRIPKRISFLRGVCWANPKAGDEIPIDANGDGGGNGEGFGTDPEPRLGPANPTSNTQWDACDCDVEPSTGAPCADEVGSLNPVEGTFRDEFFFPSPNYSKPFYCRELLDRKSEIVDANSSGLMPPVIWSAERCGINYFSYCAGKGKNDEAHCNEYEEGQEEPWLDGERHQQWNQLHLDLSNVRLGYDKFDAAPGPNLLVQDEPTRDFKNRIISTLKDLPDVETGVPRPDLHPFEQMDYMGVRTNGRDIEHWGREYRPVASGAEFTPAFQLHKCRLRKTGAPVTVIPFVVEAKIKMNFQLIREDHTPLGEPSQEERQRFYPHCRFHLVIQMGYRAISAWSEDEPPRLKNSFLPEDHPDFVEGWTALEILNFDDAEYPHYLYEGASVFPAAGHNMPPIVRRMGDIDDGLRDRQPDRILYIDDNGKPFDPPSRIDWWGFMGVHSARPSEDVWGEHAHADRALSCCNMQNYALQNLQIGGWPMIYQTTAWEKEHASGLEEPGDWDNAQIYGGFVRLEFATWDDTCPEGAGT